MYVHRKKAEYQRLHTALNLVDIAKRVSPRLLKDMKRRYHVLKVELGIKKSRKLSDERLGLDGMVGKIKRTPALARYHTVRINYA